MKLTLTADDLKAYYSELHDANAAFKAHYPADSSDRQPVHTVYGGANLFKAGFASKLGEVALRTLDTYAPNYYVFARVLNLPGAETLPTNADGDREPDPGAGNESRTGARDQAGRVARVHRVQPGRQEALHRADRGQPHRLRGRLRQSARRRGRRPRARGGGRGRQGHEREPAVAVHRHPREDVLGRAARSARSARWTSS